MKKKTKDPSQKEKSKILNSGQTKMLMDRKREKIRRYRKRRSLRT